MLASLQTLIPRLEEIDTLFREGSLDMRVTAATNKNLETAIKERTFREDLYYRLNVIHIQTPPLRKVPEDIPNLANHFLNKYCQFMQTDLKQFTPAALQSVLRYIWPRQRAAVGKWNKTSRRTR